VREGIVAGRGKTARNIAKVATARRMFEVVYYVLHDGPPPHQGCGISNGALATRRACFFASS
jgi:hypothetical protein